MNQNLTKQEKEQIKHHLISYMEANPVRNSEVQRHKVWHEKFRSLLYKLNPKNMYALLLKPASMVISGVIVFTGGTGIAAQQSLPGDALYPVKVGQEEVRSWFALSTEAQAELSLELAEERLREAEELAVKGELTAEKRADLEARFNDRMKDAYDDMAVLRGDEKYESAADFSSRVKTQLNVHTKVLEGISIKDEKGKPEVDNLIIKVKTKLSENDEKEKEIKSEFEAQEDTKLQVSAEGKLKAAENKIAEVENFIENKREEVTTGARVEALAKVESAKSLVAEGKVKLEAGAYAEAFNLFQEAHSISQEAKLTIQAAANLKIELSEEDDEDELPEKSPEIELNIEPKVELEEELKLDLRL